MGGIEVNEGQGLEVDMSISFLSFSLLPGLHEASILPTTCSHQDALFCHTKLPGQLTIDSTI